MVLAASLALLVGAYTIANHNLLPDQPGRSDAVRSSVDVANPPHKPLRPTTCMRGPGALDENGWTANFTWLTAIGKTTVT